MSKNNLCCECGKPIPEKIKGQTRCVPCIMARKPKRPKPNNNDIFRSEYVEWVIYEWRKIRRAAVVKFGVELQNKRDGE